MWVLLGAHNPVDTLFYTAAIPGAVFNGVLFSACYLAIEPWVRRSWPHGIITWERCIAGRWQDPVVARDILIGLAGAALSGCVDRGVGLFVIQFGGRPAGPIPFFGDLGFVLDNLMGWPAVASTLVVAVFQGATLSLAAFFILFLGRSLFKRPWMASVMFLVVTAGFGPIPYFARGEWMNGAVGVALLVVALPVMLRFGLLATAVWICMGRYIAHSLLTTNLTAWYGLSSFTAIIIVSMVSLWAFRVAIGGWSALRLTPLST